MLIFSISALIVWMLLGLSPAAAQRARGPGKRAIGQPLTAQLPGGAEMVFVWIEPGTFAMGSPESEPELRNERPQHQVTITRGFYLGKYEVTQEQWEAVMGTRPWEDKNWVHSHPRHPAVYISWDAAEEFVARLNQSAGEGTYRLPTEAEWEYACRAGTVTRWSFGEGETRPGEHAWYRGNIGEGIHARPVGTKRPNPWGLHDMHGNVWEWCSDWYGSDYYRSSAKVDPEGPASGSARVLRGGSWVTNPWYCRSAYRLWITPECRFSIFGFRPVVLDFR